MAVQCAPGERSGSVLFLQQAGPATRHAKLDPTVNCGAMTALITGGTGFIGSSLARRLLDDGYDVRVFPLIARDAEGANARALERAGAEVVEGAVADRSLHQTALDGVGVVYHVAAGMREANPPDRVFWETNLQATRHLATRGRERGVRRFVYCSTMGGPAGRVGSGSTKVRQDVRGCSA